VTRTFTTKIKGIESEIEILDDLPWIEIRNMMMKCFDVKSLNDVKLDFWQFNEMLVEKAIVKAPFDPKNPTERGMIDGLEMAELMNKLGEYFPLGKYLQPIIKLLQTEIT
jgi:hypothetical protein